MCTRIKGEIEKRITSKNITAFFSVALNLLWLYLINDRYNDKNFTVQTPKKNNFSFIALRFKKTEKMTKVPL